MAEHRKSSAYAGAVLSVGCGGGSVESAVVMVAGGPRRAAARLSR